VGAIKGSISYALFEVDGSLGDRPEGRILERLHEYRFQELTAAHEEDSRSGWCVMTDMLDTVFTNENVFRNEYICFGLRTDRWSLPGALLKARIAREEEAVRERTGRTRLYKSEREAVRDAQSRLLKAQLVPSAASIDVVWNTQKKQLRIWTLSPARLDLFDELFVPTFGAEFGVRLVRRRPYTAAMAAGLSAEQIARIDTLNRFIYNV
jgi:hypothetical protein